MKFLFEILELVGGITLIFAGIPIVVYILGEWYLNHQAIQNELERRKIYKY